MRHLLCTTLLLVGCLVLPTALEADEIGFDDYTQAPKVIDSTPARPFRDREPSTFEVVSEHHAFHGSQLPRVGDTQPQVLIRSYDADNGVYLDEQVHDREPRPGMTSTP